MPKPNFQRNRNGWVGAPRNDSQIQRDRPHVPRFAQASRFDLPLAYARCLESKKVARGRPPQAAAREESIFQSKVVQLGPRRRTSDDNETRLNSQPRIRPAAPRRHICFFWSFWFAFS